LHPTHHCTRRLPRVCSVACTFLLLLIVALPQLESTAPGIAWASLDQQVSQVAPDTNLLVAEISGESCQTIHAVRADNQLAIASTFKIYVLRGVARQVQDGTLGWDMPVTITDSLRSMPSGDFAWMPIWRYRPRDADPTAAAIGNAIFDAKCIYVREAPFTLGCIPAPIGAR
jgi:hypothetical protein